MRRVILLLLGCLTLTVSNNEAAFGGLKRGSQQPSSFKSDRLDTVMVDENPDWDVEYVAQLLCDRSSPQAKLISRLSTITRLSDYFTYLQHNLGGRLERLPVSIGCLESYASGLSELDRVIRSHEEDVCGDSKLRLIETFHRQHIAGPLMASAESQSPPVVSSMPDALRLVFMHYAIEVTETCKWNLINGLEVDADHLDSLHAMATEERSLLRLIDVMEQYFGSPQEIKDYGDFVLVWSMLEDYGDREGELMDEVSIDPRTGERRGLLIKAKFNDGIGRLQVKCQRQLAPVYSQLVAPVMRLIELGYHRPSAETLAANLRLQDWYRLAQACEALKPIRVLEDRTMQSGQVIVISEEEAAALQRSQPQQSLVRWRQEVEPLAYRPPNPLALNDDLLASMFQLNPVELVRLVQGNLKQRRHQFKRILSNVALQCKGKLRSKLRNFSLSKLAKQQRHAEDLVPLGEELDSTGGQMPLFRSKRSPFSRKNKSKTMAPPPAPMRVASAEAYVLVQPEMQPQRRKKSGPLHRLKRLALLSILMTVIALIAFAIVIKFA